MYSPVRRGYGASGLEGMRRRCYVFNGIVVRNNHSFSKRFLECSNTLAVAEMHGVQDKTMLEHSPGCIRTTRFGDRSTNTKNHCDCLNIECATDNGGRDILRNNSRMIHDVREAWMAEESFSYMVSNPPMSSGPRSADDFRFCDKPLWIYGRISSYTNSIASDRYDRRTEKRFPCYIQAFSLDSPG